MSYLVSFSTNDGDNWTQTFDTEQELLEYFKKRPQEENCIDSIQKVEKELTLRQVQEQVDNKTPQELQEADYNGKHIKVGDIVYFCYEWIDRYDETCYETYYGRIKSIIQRYKEIRPTISVIAYKDGTVMKEDDYNTIYRPNEVQYHQINEIYDVCTPEYFDKLIQKAEDAKGKNFEEMKKEHDKFCKEQDKQIKIYKVLKGVL